MRIKWTEAQAVGIEKIDNQHELLFNSINDLVDAMNQGKGSEEIEKLFVFMENYTIEHFTDEEEYMEKYNYPEPERSTHIAAHEGFKDSFVELKEKMTSSGATRSMAVRVSSMLGSWWIAHINNIDKALGSYLKQHIKD
ncbi:MAG: hemerythrin family protein [Deltaproteobacteria bacterium]|nr:hemerythrin family protein [Deltaproteobacteria bacterium]